MKAAAAAGWTPVPGALEDYLLPRSGLRPDAAALTDGIGADGAWDRFALDENYVKFWPACGHTHTAIGATLALLESEAFAPEQVDTIEIDTFRAAANLDEREPVNELAARFSIPAVVSAAIVDDGFGVDALRPAQLADPRWRELARVARSAFVLVDEPGTEPGVARGDGLVEIALAPHSAMRREWAVVCDSPELSAALSAWELPGQEDVRDGDRLFESVWTVDPVAVRDAARVCARTAQEAGSAEAAPVLYDLASPVVPGAADLGAVTTLFNRVVAYVDEVSPARRG